MPITKRFKCVHCGGVIECNENICSSTCTCGKLKMSGNIIIEGNAGVDYIDVSPKLLNG